MCEGQRNSMSSVFEIVLSETVVSDGRKPNLQLDSLGAFLLQIGVVREGANREKLTVKKIINNEMFFFTVYIPYKP